MKPAESQLIFLRNKQTADSPMWNMSSFILLDRKMPYDKLNDALNEITFKNDALRLRPVFNDESVELIVDPFVFRTFEQHVFDSKEQFLEWANEIVNTSVFEQPGMWTAYIIEIGDQSGVFNIGHHAMSDGYNVVTLYRKLLKCISGEEVEEQSYSAHLENERIYRDSKRFEKDRRFWNDELRHSSDLKVFENKPNQPDKHCVNQTFKIDADLTRKLKMFCLKQDVSEAVFIYAATALTVFHLSRSYRFSIGIPVLNRSNQSEMDQLGLFMNIVPLVVNIDETDCISFIHYIEEKLFNIFRHQQFNPDELRLTESCSGSSISLYEISVDYTEYGADFLCDSHVLYNNYSSVPFELHFLQKEGDILECTMRCWDSVRSESVSSFFSRTFKSVLESIIKDGTADTLFLPFISRQITEFCLTDVPYEKNKSVFDLFLLQAHKHLNAEIIDQARKYSFDQLEADSTKIDSFVREHVGNEKQIVGLLCDRSYNELASIFGIIRGGNAYLPIAPDWPESRIRALLETSLCKLVLCQKKYEKLVCSAKIIEDILSEPLLGDPQLPAAKPDDTLYVIFTSGSTGTPKGAMVSNRSIVNRINWMAKRFWDESSIVMRKTPYTFDVSAWEIFGFAMFGFSLYILPPEDHLKQSAVLSHIELGKVTDIHFVPSVFEQFLSVLKKDSDAKQKLRSIRHIILSGEALLAKDVNEFRQYHDGQISLHNLYGPAECAIDVTAFNCSETEVDPIPIGRPIDNTKIYITDRFLKPVPVGVTGELCVAGDNVGDGYLNRPELTKELFVDNPFGVGKLYKTGDLAYWRDDGNIVFVGRKDFQVKINGQRVEPGEIEFALCLLDGVENAATIIRRFEKTRPVICAFYTGNEIETHVFRQSLSTKLPIYMIPAFFIHLDEMPLNSSGKIDRDALLKMDLPSDVINNDYDPPKSNEEKDICLAFGRILNLDLVGRSDNFYDLGGSSFDIIRLLSIEPMSVLTPGDFMENPTPAALAKKLNLQSNYGPSFLQNLFIPNNPKKAIVLFPFAGGDASAYTAIVAEARNKNYNFALYLVDWGDEQDYLLAADEIEALSEVMPVHFYSHCAGAAIALKLLMILNDNRETVSSYIAGAHIPPKQSKISLNPWHVLTDNQIIRILIRAGMLPFSDNHSLQNELIRRFRENTDQLFELYSEIDKPLTCKTNLIISKNDLFTKNYRSAKKHWLPYVNNVDSVYLLDNEKGHYFQSTNAEVVLSIIDSITNTKI